MSKEVIVFFVICSTRCGLERRFLRYVLYLCIFIVEVVVFNFDIPVEAFLVINYKVAKRSIAHVGFAQLTRW